VTSQNYVVNFGNTSATQDASLDGVPFLGAPFTDIGSPITAIYGASTSPSMSLPVVPLSAITDGLSNTMLTSEVVVGQGNDLRGFSWWFESAAYEGYLGPNSMLPDMMQSQGNCNYPAMGNPPCKGADSILSVTTAARSRHPGGVNAGMADGSVRFFKDSIALSTWRALSTTRGGEIVSGDAY
jgi:prepilin-type processing-associated H-X9-DG protein